MANSLFDNFIVDVALVTTDIPNTNQLSTFYSMANSSRALFIVSFDSWADACNLLQVMQGTNSVGAGAKAISYGTGTMAFSSSFPTATGFGGLVTGAKAVLEVRAIDLDFDNSFTFVGIQIKAASTGTNNATIVCVRDYKYDHRNLNAVDANIIVN